MQTTVQVPGSACVPAAVNHHEAVLVATLREGDETAFATLVARYHPLLIRLALPIVGEMAVAEEVAQETWLEVVRGVQRFEGRSALKTWLCAILVNRARSRARGAQIILPPFGMVVASAYQARHA